MTKQELLDELERIKDGLLDQDNMIWYSRYV